jgi:hypothetical protein
MSHVTVLLEQLPPHARAMFRWNPKQPLQIDSNTLNALQGTGPLPRRLTLHFPTLHSGKAVQLLIDQVVGVPYRQTRSDSDLKSDVAPTISRNDDGKSQVAVLTPEEDVIYNGRVVEPRPRNGLFRKVEFALSRRNSCSVNANSKSDDEHVPCGAYVSARQKSAPWTNDAFTLKITVCWQHDHASNKQPPRLPLLTERQLHKAATVVSLLPLHVLSTAQVTHIFNDNATEMLTARAKFDFLVHDMSLTQVQPDAAPISQHRMARIMKELGERTGSGTALSSNKPDLAARQALEMGALINLESGDKQFTLKATDIRVDDDHILVIAPEAGQRAVSVLRRSAQERIVLNCDGTHKMVASDGDLKLTSFITRVCGVATFLGAICHHAQSLPVLTAGVAALEVMLNVKNLVEAKKVVSFMTDDDASLRGALVQVYGPKVPLLQCLWHAFVNFREHYGRRLNELLARCDKNGALRRIVLNQRSGEKKKIFQFVDASSMSLTALQHLEIELESELNDSATPESIARRKRVALDSKKKADVAARINSTLSAMFKKQFGDDAVPYAPHTSKSAASADAAQTAAPEVEEEAITDESLSALLDVNDDAADAPHQDQARANGARRLRSLLPLVYKVVDSNTEEEYEINRKELALVGALCGLADFVYDYLFAHKLSRENAKSIVRCYTNEQTNGDATNNTSEQVHRVMGEGGLLKDRRAKAGLVDLAGSIVEFSHKNTLVNYANVVAKSSDSSPYQTALRKSNALARNVNDIEVNSVVTDGDYNVISAVVSGKSGVEHTVYYTPYATCDCRSFKMRKICRHAVKCERELGFPSPPFRADTLDDYHKKLMREIAVGAGDVDVATEMAGAGAQLVEVGGEREWMAVDDNDDTFDFNGGFGDAVDDDRAPADTDPDADVDDHKVSVAVSADARALAEAKVAKFLLHGLSDRELLHFAEHANEPGVAPSATVKRLLVTAFPSAHVTTTVVKRRQTHRVKKPKK